MRQKSYHTGKIEVKGANSIVERSKIILMTFSWLIAPELIKMTISDVACGVFFRQNDFFFENLVNITTLLSQCST